MVVWGVRAEADPLDIARSVGRPGQRFGGGIYQGLKSLATIARPPGEEKVLRAR